MLFIVVIYFSPAHSPFILFFRLSNKSIIENDILKVADKIIFLQNNGVKNINEQINKGKYEKNI
jgi:hypothetical protein